jgi:hypothetical protein
MHAVMILERMDFDTDWNGKGVETVGLKTSSSLTIAPDVPSKATSRLTMSSIKFLDAYIGDEVYGH